MNIKKEIDGLISQLDKPTKIVANLSERKKLEGYKPYLKAIDKAVDALEKYDRNDGYYGDMAQNFEDATRDRLTKRLYKLINDDIKALRR